MESIVAEWAPRATVVLARRTDRASATPELVLASKVFPPAEEVACDFRVFHYEPVEGEVPRLLTMEEIAIQERKGLPITVHAALVQTLQPMLDEPRWWSGTELAASGLTLDVLRALWAIHQERLRYLEMRYVFFKGEANPTFEQQLYLQNYRTRFEAILPLSIPAIHVHASLHLTLYTRAQKAWQRRRHLLALCK